MRERSTIAVPGLIMVVVVIALFVAGFYALTSSLIGDEVINVPAFVLAILVMVAASIAITGFTVIQPNQSAVVTFLGAYVGTVRANGFRWTWPLTTRRVLSFRVQNFDSQILKVNDAVGNPVEVAAVIVWRVVDTAKAAFEVENYQDFVRIQTETAVRHMASLYPYDSYDASVPSLRANADQVMASLHRELQEQLVQAGVEVIRTQLRRLAYAPEIAGDMLRRQQAEAVVAARSRIVEGAVGMVDQALAALSAKKIIDLDEERKAAMVSNLLVVLCGESRPQPVVNTGTLYQ
ncbi:MAG TPA: SPFH domain-containing protein [Candidatus Limnocylindrales bacterium]|jgi:regulator of protease activity HflC (stomatin/prohibitin superfamily)